MDILITIVAFLIAFSILVLAHEFGHFIVAKRNGIKVEEFGFGLPPKLWGKKKGETLYSINAIPFGGFVRMMGESDTKVSRSKRSFSGKSKRIQIKVLAAGVAMNFLLAWVLITVGFSFGMEPMLGPDDIYGAVDNGVIQLEEGLKIEEIGTFALNAGLKSGDKIVKYNGQDVSGFAQLEDSLKKGGEYSILRDGQYFVYSIDGSEVEGEALADLSEFFTYEDYLMFPRVRIYDVKEWSSAYRAGLRDGDTIVSINGEGIYAVDDYLEAIGNESEAYFEIYRGGKRDVHFVEFPVARKVIVSNVVEGKPGDMVGFKDSDVVLSVNGYEVNTVVSLIEYITANADQVLTVKVDRHGQLLFFEVTPENGKIGLYLTELYLANGPSDISVYSVDQVSTLVGIEEEKYPIYSAPFHALSETWRLTKLTGTLFKDLVGNVISTGEVPDTVAGPVGIAQMSGMFAREGAIPFIRFIALLSISLAVLNILPFPALDGGKLLFILIEFVIGRKIPTKWENLIHLFGFVIIIGLILAISFNDIMRIF